MAHEDSNRMKPDLSNTHAYARAYERSTMFLLNAWFFIFGLFMTPAATLLALPVSPNDFQMMRSSDTGVCLPAIKRLGQSHDNSVLPALMAAFGKEKRPVVRRYLVESLGLLRDAAATPVLIQALQDPDAQMRESAVLALEQVGGDDADAALIAHVQNEHDLGAKQRLVGILNRSRNPKADDSLKILANDTDPNVRMAAQKAITARLHKHSKNKGDE